MKKLMVLLLFVLIASLCSVNSVMAEKKSDYNGLNVNSSAFLRDRKEVSYREYERKYNNLTPEKKAGPIGESIIKIFAPVHLSPQQSYGVLRGTR